MKKFLEKHTELFLIILISVITFFISISNRLLPDDTLWNFGNIYKYYNGDILYTQVNYILTPIFIVIGRIMFSFLGPNFITFAIYNCIIVSSLFLIFYKILKVLKVKQVFAIIITLICFLSIQDKLIMSGANYNTLAFVFYELGILILLKDITNNEYNIRSNIIQGIMLFLVFFTNQKLLIGYGLALFVFELIYFKKKGIINLLQIAGVFILESLIALQIFYLRGNLYDFINICFLGIHDFKANLIADAVGPLYFIIYITSIIVSITLISRTEIERVKNNIELLLCFSVGSFALCFPIFNVYHCGLPGTLFLLLLMYSLYEGLIDLFEDKSFREVIKYVCIIIVVVFILCIPKYTMHIFINYDYIEKDPYSPYFGAILKEEFRTNIKNVTKYLQEQESQGKQTYIVSNYAMYYVIETGKSHDYFDMLNRGNYGINGDDKMIEKIKNMKNTIILVYNKERSAHECYQITVKIKDYIEKNYNCVGEVENYDIYVINN